MTTDHPTESAAISRRTILRTSAHAAWMVPAISLATAVPAMAACSLTTDFTLTGGALGSISYDGGLGYRTAAYTVSNAQDGSSSGAAGTATLIVTVEQAAQAVGIDMLPSTAGWSISVSGWADGPTSGQPGETGSSYVFTRSFGCGETAPASVTYSWTSTLGLNTPPVISATVSP